MNQATIEWLPTANGCWIGCTEEGEVVYENGMISYGLLFLFLRAISS